MLLRSVLFWDIKRRRVVMLYRRFGQRIFPIFKGQVVFLDFLIFEDGIYKLSRNVGKGLPLGAALISQKGADLNLRIIGIPLF
jgi:hypothetical protein